MSPWGSIAPETIEASQPCTVPGKRFGDLACQPLGRRIAGHREPQQAPPFVAQNKKCEQLLKGNRRKKQKDRSMHSFHMIAKEGLPGLQWSIPPGHHIDRNRGLGDIDAQREQLAMDLGGAPQRVLNTHSSDQVAHFLSDRRPASRRTGFPSPVCGKTPSMPAHDSLGPDDGYGIKDAGTTAIEPNEQRAVDPTQMQSTAWRALPKNVELMSQYQDFGLQPPSRLEAVAQYADERRPTAIMRRSCSDSPMTASQMDGVFGSDKPQKLPR